MADFARSNPLSCSASTGPRKWGTSVPPFGSRGRQGLPPLATPRPWGAAPNPAAFEKAGKTFTFLHLTQARGRYVPVGRCPAADRGGSREVGCGGAVCRWQTLCADRAGRRDFLGGPTARRGLPQACLKPAPSARRPLAEATAVFQSRVPPRPGRALCAARRAGAALHFFPGCAGLRPRDAVSRSANF